MDKRVGYVCSFCGSSAVLMDAWAVWDTEEQDWESHDTLHAKPSVASATVRRALTRSRTGDNRTLISASPRLRAKPACTSCLRVKLLSTTRS